MRFHAALALAVCLAPAIAVFEDEAYNIDFHYALLGLPRDGATFFQRPYASSKASLLYTISQNETIGAVNPKDGALVWRHHLPSANHPKGHLRTASEQDTVISAVGHHVAAWAASDGRLVWETSLDGSMIGDLEILEREEGATIDQGKDVLVLLTEGKRGVKRLDGKTGKIKWTFEDTSGDVPFQLSTSPAVIYYIATHSPMLGRSQIRITSLDLNTGKNIDRYTLSSELESSSSDTILFAGANTAAPLLAWTDKSNKVLKVNIIGSKEIFSFDTPSDEVIEQIVLHAPNRIDSASHFLVQYQTAVGHSAEVYYVDLKKKTVKKAYSLPEKTSKGIFTTSTFDNNVYFTRITEDEVSIVSSASEGILGHWTLNGSPVLAGAYPEHGTSEVVMKAGKASAVRSAVLYSNGQWAMIRNEEIAWTRPEFLSQTVSAVWAGLPEQEALAQALTEEGDRTLVSAYIHRANRHIRDLKHLPAWVQNLPNRLLGSVLGKSKETLVGAIQQDTFGFHKLILLVTSTGRLAALDIGSRGRVLWNVDIRQLIPDVALNHPVLKAFSGYVEIRDNNLAVPLLVNTTTGGLLGLAETDQHRTTNPNDQVFTAFSLVDGVLKGFLENQPISEPVWSFTPSNGERILSYTARPLQDPVASIGRVLGDRRVLYKYLNPNLVLVTTVLESARTASLYLLDSASGRLLHSISHQNIDTSRPISSTISENWYAYSMTIDAESGASSRGFQLTVSDLYESPLPDDRGMLGNADNSSFIHPSGKFGEATTPYVLSQSYQIPAEISYMTVTQTRQGITSRELLVTVPSWNAILGIPRMFIDPRRPIGRDPNADEQAEGLMKYSPLIAFEPSWHLTHKYEVLGVSEIITSESGIESTSLIFAYGFDIFGTRVAPSFVFDVLGKSFNKVSMMLTVLALFISVIFVAPLVVRKQINMLWTVQ